MSAQTDTETLDVAVLFAVKPRGAVLSEDRVYRYFLWRAFDPTKPAVNFIGLNPSTADEHADDPTIRRCIAFAKAWGYGAVFMTNIYAIRSTDPKGLRALADPVGRDNDSWLEAVAGASGLVVACWGKSVPDRGERGQAVLSRLYDRAHHLGLNSDGSPKHPLYLRGDTRPTPFNPASAVIGNSLRTPDSPRLFI